MHLVTLSHVDPIGIWVDQYPVVVPFFDSILVPDAKAFDLAEEWSTDVRYLDKAVEYNWMVWLPSGLAANVRYCGEWLGLL